MGNSPSKKPGKSTVITQKTITYPVSVECLRCAEACDLSYSLNSPDLDEHVKKWGYKDIRERNLDDGNLRYLVMHGRRSVTFVFRGTANLKNIASDADLHDISVDESLGGVRFHQGFYECAQKLYTDVLKFANASQKIYVFGHSLGGAIAVIISLWLKRDKYRVVRTMTIGQPSVLFEEDVHKVEGLIRLTRIVNEDDPICLIPLLTPTHPYMHFGSRIFLGPKGLSTAKDLESNQIAELLTSDVNEHRATMYIARCQLLVDETKTSGSAAQEKDIFMMEDVRIEMGMSVSEPEQAVVVISASQGPGVVPTTGEPSSFPQVLETVSQTLAVEVK